MRISFTALPLRYTGTFFQVIFYSTYFLQRCTVNLQVQELDRKSMKISPNKLRMIGKTILTQYYITQWSLEYKDKGINCLELFNV